MGSASRAFARFGNPSSSYPDCGRGSLLRGQSGGKKKSRESHGSVSLSRKVAFLGYMVYV
jgi:hypothetical protein